MPSGRDASAASARPEPTAVVDTAGRVSPLFDRRPYGKVCADDAETCDHHRELRVSEQSRLLRSADLRSVEAVAPVPLDQR
jgi:hypothetical protein